MTSKAKYLCVQFQPNLASKLSMAEVKRLFQVAAENSKIASYEADEDGENAEYVNFLFKTNCLAELWEFMRDFLYEKPIFGELLSQATIVTCEGEDGWDDYLLLHHFDRLVQTDKLSKAVRP